MLDQIQDFLPKVLQLKNFLIKLDKDFEKRVVNYLATKNKRITQKDWLYRTILNSTGYDFCTYIGSLSGLIGVDPTFKTNAICLLESDNYPLKLRFFGYFLLFTYYRHKRDYSVARQYMEQYYELFHDEDQYLVTRSIILRYSNLKEEIEHGIRIALELVMKKSYQDNVNIYTTYANAILTGIEEEIPLILEKKEYYLHKSIEFIQSALVQKEYAKNRFLLGKLLFYAAIDDNDSQSLLKKAKKSIQRAIDVEDSFREDYSLRILEYQSCLIRITVYLDSLRTQPTQNTPIEDSSSVTNTRFHNTISVRLENTAKQINVDLPINDFLALEFAASHKEIPIQNYLRTMIRSEIRDIKEKYNL